jgi:hypothetical protein
MNALDITEEKAKKMDKLEDSAIDILQEYFDGKRQGGDDVVAARCVMNFMRGNRQTQTAREALRFNMVTAITEDPKVLKKYVNATQPEIKKLLGK